MAKKIAKPKKVIKSVSKKNEESFEVQTLFKAKIKVIGIGGGGGSIVSDISKLLQKATFVVADTDLRALKKKSGFKYLWFGQNLTRGLGTGVNVDLGRQAAEADKEKISQLFKNQDIVILVSSLGGGLGSGATQIFADAAASFGAITFGIFTLPFKFEGKNKARIALKALKEIRPKLNVSLTIPNERIFKVINADTPITDAFSTVNKNLINSLESLIDLIYNPGVINIDFADLRTILNGKGNLAFLNTVEESGKERAEETSKKILTNPLYQTGGFEAEKILFNIAGGPNLAMFEVEKISRTIAELNPKAKIIFGISREPKLKNKIKTTILMVGPDSAKEAAREPAKKEVKREAPKKPIKKAKKPIPSPIFIPALEESPVKLSVIRRSGLDIKQAQEAEEQSRAKQEEEWEIPAFLRKAKSN